MNRHKALNRLLLSNPLDHIPRLQIHEYGIPRILDAMVQPLDLTERRLQPVPLRRILVAARRDGQGVREGRVVSPEGELGQRGPPCKEVENRADDGALLVGERDAGRGLNIFGLDVEVGGW